MDARRASRNLIDPKVRRVGFFPPDPTPFDDSSSSNSLSPFMIPLPRQLPGRTAVVPVPESVPLTGDHVAATTTAEKKEEDDAVQSSSTPLKAKTTKAERRALQEAQRAAKAASKAQENKPVAESGRGALGSKATKQSLHKKDGPPLASSVAPDKKSGDQSLDKDRKKEAPPPAQMQFDDKTRVEKFKKRAVVSQTESKNRVELFLHLPQYERRTQLPNLEPQFFHIDSVHPAVYKVGLSYLAGDISGGNARCIAMLKAFQEAIRDYCTPPEKILVIVGHISSKVKDGDVLLTYGFSTVVEMILLYAHELGKQFRVVVVDSRPKLEGQALLRRLVSKGLRCTYTHINAVSYIMSEVTRVFLGASAVLSNGSVYSGVGSSCIAMVAHAFHVPVLICCEAYKFHERVQLDSICFNELGDPDVVARVPGRKDVDYLDNWTSKDNLRLLNLMYDTTPSDYVSAIVTDYGIVPPTSVPVIVREYGREHLLM